MASYYDEHDCQELRDGETPNHFLHLARLLLDTGVGVEWELEYDRITGGERKQPPASTKIMETLPKTNDFAKDEQCPICLKELVKDETVKLPCDHKFHSVCILPWLKMVNTCPVCRLELPTDDPDYEEYRRQKEQLKKRDAMLEDLHSSMFG